MKLHLTTFTYIIAKIMLFTSDAKILQEYRKLWTSACKSGILIIEMNTCASKWIDKVKNEYIQEKTNNACMQGFKTCLNLNKHKECI